MVLLDNYFQIFSLATPFVRGGLKIFDLCLTKTPFGNKKKILKRQLTAIYTHSCTNVYTSVRKILFPTALKSFFKAAAACPYGPIAVRTPAHGTKYLKG